MCVKSGRTRLKRRPLSCVRLGRRAREAWSASTLTFVLIQRAQIFALAARRAVAAPWAIRSKGREQRPFSVQKTGFLGYRRGEKLRFVDQHFTR